MPLWIRQWRAKARSRNGYCLEVWPSDWTQITKEYLHECPTLATNCPKFMGLGLQQSCPENGCWLLLQHKTYPLVEFSHPLEIVSCGLFKFLPCGVWPSHQTESCALLQSADVNDNIAQKNTFIWVSRVILTNIARCCGLAKFFHKINHHLFLLMFCWLVWAEWKSDIKLWDSLKGLGLKPSLPFSHFPNNINLSVFYSLHL